MMIYFAGGARINVLAVNILLSRKRAERLKRQTNAFR